MKAKLLDGHAGDCAIYASLVSGTPEAGICTCGYGLRQLRKGNPKEMYSEERREATQNERSSK